MLHTLMHINWPLLGILAVFTVVINFVKGWREAGRQGEPLERHPELVGRSLSSDDAAARQKGPWD